MGECAKIGRGRTAMYVPGVGRSPWSFGIKKASRRCFVEANNQWELPCSQDVFLVHHPSELKVGDFCPLCVQWRVEKEVVMRHCELSAGSEGPLQATEEEGAIRKVLQWCDWADQEAILPSLTCSTWPSLRGSVEKASMILESLVVIQEEEKISFSNMVVTHEEEAAKTQLVSIKKDLVVRALDHNKKVVRKGERPRSV
ncbi:hypothetical protein DY000_02034650 [Brassica cretica]|uniref:Uncharacterized protein n=1 Tax=Brassica cretica TaxID=69181 RepID=A0ABQ7DPL7_BRACR|nr:hypothetical protein DY000_02034650 [Brassica cretica]